jgi:hypothetical protein
MTCSNNSITTQDHDNMYRYRFLLEKDRKKLITLLIGRVSAWVSNWAFSSDFNLTTNNNGKNSSLNPGSSSDVFEKVGAKGLLIYCDDVEFSWANFLLDEYLDACPKDKVLTNLLDQAKESFLLEVFETKRSREPSDTSRQNSTFSGFMSIDLTVPGAGTLTLRAHQSAWFSLLNEPASKLTRSKLSGRFSAVERLKIHAEVSTSLGQVPFLELVNLPDTKLLQSASDIDNLFKFTINGLPICDVALGRVGTGKAVLVQEISK